MLLAGAACAISKSEDDAAQKAPNDAENAPSENAPSENAPSENGGNDNSQEPQNLLPGGNSDATGATEETEENQDLGSRYTETAGGGVVTDDPNNELCGTDELSTGGQQAEHVVSQEPIPETGEGGTIQPGTYRLVEWISDGDQYSTGEKMGSLLILEASSGRWLYDEGVDEERSSFTWTTGGDDYLLMTYSCPSSIEGEVNGLHYTSSGDSLIIYSDRPSIEVYERQ